MSCADQLLLATVDLYTRSGCPLALEPLYRIVREDGRDRVVRAWHVTVYHPTVAPKLPESE